MIKLTRVTKGLYRVKGCDGVTVAHRPFGPAGSQLPWVVTQRGSVLSDGAKETKHSSLRSARFYIEKVCKR